ncbi:MAG: diacylglycerol/lipid kinase family protein [Anaerolineae bacterium]
MPNRTENEVHAFVVLNPVAGSDDSDTIRQILERGLSEAGWSYDLHETRANEDIEAVVREAPPEIYDVVIAAGGDGTVSGVAGGLIHTEVPMGVVPVGTGNALARDLGIPMSPEEAIQLITGPHATETVDALRIGDNHYFLNISVGVSAGTMEGAKRDEKRRMGLLAYLISGIQELAGIQPARFELTVDGVSHTIKAADVIVFNKGVIGSTLVSQNPYIDLDSGEVGVFIFRSRSAFRYLISLIETVLGRAGDSRHVETMRASDTIVIRPAINLPIQADGEPLDLDAVEAHIIPQAVRVIVAT